jgi:hypothetical protein
MMDWSRELLKSWKSQQDIKKDILDCLSCGCPITKKDFDEYNKMCSWCYSQVLLEID